MPPVMVGKMVSHYRILEKLGGGGMGVVYKAEDVKLGRFAAIKFLPDDVAMDRLALDRFQREARTASALNHPNICTIYEIDEHDGRPFIAMELLEGKTLKEQLAGKPLRLQQILDFTIQATDALEKAHAKGIVHRDIKPENIFITTESKVKIMDFGLAKSAEDLRRLDDASMLPTAGGKNTDPGSAVGTIAYMSPEQVRGEDLDARTDLFSLGDVLYEMCTGQPPFSGKTAGLIFHAILEKQPAPISQLNPALPARLEDIVDKAIEKDRDFRYQHASDLRADLKRLKRESDSSRGVPVMPAPPPPPKKASSPAKIWIAALFVGAMAGLVVGLLRRPVPVAFPDFLKNATFTALTRDPGQEDFPSISPDGKVVVYASGGNVFSLRVGGANPVKLTDDPTAKNNMPAFSPDGDLVAFARSDHEAFGIYVMGATGESVRRLTDFGGNPAWSPDGKSLVFSSEPVTAITRTAITGKLWIVDVASGDKRQIKTIDAVQPSWSPNGKRIAFWSIEHGGVPTAGQRDIWTIQADGKGDAVPVTDDLATDISPTWSPDGKYLYFSSDRGGPMNLWRVAIDEDTGKTTGAPEPITTGGSAERFHLTISRDGSRMIYVENVSASNLHSIAFDPVTAKTVGLSKAISRGARSYTSPDVSPDGQWIAFQTSTGNQDIYISRIDGSDIRQLTNDVYRDVYPQWSPDGKQLLFYSNESGNYELWVIEADGSGRRQVTESHTDSLYASWSPDGKHIVYVGRNAAQKQLLTIIDSARPWNEQTPQTFDGEAFEHPVWAPDGQKIAFAQTSAPGDPGGLAILTLATSKIERVLNNDPMLGTIARPRWMADSHRIIFGTGTGGRVYLFDTASKASPNEIFSVSPDGLGGAISLSRDNRTLYYSVTTSEADLWMLEIKH